MKLIVAPRAKLDFVGHFTYLLGRNAAAAIRFKESLHKAYQRIRKEPRGCATLALEGFDDLELRFCRPGGFDNYLVVFQVTDTGPIVLRVIHSSQDIVTALRGA